MSKITKEIVFLGVASILIAGLPSPHYSQITAENETYKTDFLSDSEILTYVQKPFQASENSSLSMIGNNSILPVSETAYFELKVTQQFRVIATAYSSSPQQTDSTPFITAAGTRVRDGIIANNLLPFGTKVRLPEIYGDKVLVVEDRLHQRKGNYHIDVWCASYDEAINFGAKLTNLEVMKVREN